MWQKLINTFNDNMNINWKIIYNCILIAYNEVNIVIQYTQCDNYCFIKYTYTCNLVWKNLKWNFRVDIHIFNACDVNLLYQTGIMKNVIDYVYFFPKIINFMLSLNISGRETEPRNFKSRNYRNGNDHTFPIIVINCRINRC